MATSTTQQLMLFSEIFYMATGFVDNILTGGYFWSPLFYFSLLFLCIRSIVNCFK